MGDDGIGRRFFLRLAGATSVAAGCSPRHAAEKLVPMLNPPENLIPGRPLFYRTVCRACAAGCGMTARTREGRVIKVEGNPDEPTSAGALCARGQASVQELYAPDRFRGPMKRGAGGQLEPIGWDAALAQLAAALKAADPAHVRMLSRPEPGTAGFVQRSFLAALGAPAAARVVIDRHAAPGAREAALALYGRAEQPTYDLSIARDIVSIGADFAETWLSPVALSRGFAAGRGRAEAERTRLTWIGPRLGGTGASADRWISCAPGGELDAALLLLAAIARSAPATSLSAAAVRSALAGFDAAAAARRAGVESEAIDRLAAGLRARGPSALLGPGPAAGADAAAIATALLLGNELLGNLGRTVLLGQDALGDPPASAERVAELAAPAASGSAVLLVMDGDAAAALDRWPALGRSALVVSFASRPDAATALASLVLPDHHFLEAPGDVEVHKGTLAIAQPAMQPLFDTRPAAQALLQVGGKLGLGSKGLPAGQLPQLARKRQLARARELGVLAAGAAGERELFARGVAVAPAPHEAPPLNLDAALALLKSPAARSSPGAGPGLLLAPFPTALATADPRAPSWLREVPDLMSAVSWSSWAELSPADAARLGVRDGDLVSIALGAAAVQLPAVAQAGMRPGALGVPLAAPELRQLGGGAGSPVTVTRLAATALPRAPGDPHEHGRRLIPSAFEARADHEHEHEHEHDHEHEDGGVAEHKEAEHPYGLRSPPSHPVHRWAMTIDLDKCTGCQACVVACYAENNLAVAGPAAATEGRAQPWLRIQRSFAGEGDALEVKLLPSLCQQCDRAPCEPVCPVYATYHTSEGLNAQVYNRCIGTRYCANNCPYDARVFNWRDPVFVEPLNLQLNPDVSVRAKGIMEKCTFCVQRIRLAENDAKSAARNVIDGEVVPACAQTCPARAIVFGDLNDALARIGEVRKDARGFRLLDELNTGPAVTYLARGGRS